MTDPGPKATAIVPGALADEMLVDTAVVDLRRSASAGALFVGVSQLVKLVTQFASVIIIARLIGPQQTGIAAMIAPLLALALLFQDLGLGQATIQSERISREQVSGLFWVGLGVSGTIALVLALAAPAISRFYHTPETAGLTLAVALMTVTSSMAAQPLALLNRSLRFGAIAAIEILASLLGLAGGIGVAIATGSYWAVFAGNLASIFATCALAFALARWMPRRPRLRIGLRPLVGFGAGTSVFNIATLAARNLDKVLIGRVWGDTVLGIYDRGYKLLLFPLQQAFLPVARVMLPVLARLNDQPDRYRSVFQRCQRATLAAVQPGIVVLLVLAPDVIDALLGPKWAGTAPPFRMLGGAGLILTVNSSVTWLFFSQGRGRELAQWGLFNAAVTIVGFAVSAGYGPVVLSAVYSLSECVTGPMFWLLATRRGPVRAADVFSVVGANVVTLPLCAGATWLIGRLDAPMLVRLGVATIAAYAVALLALALTKGGRDLIAELIAMLRDGIGQAASLGRRRSAAAQP